MPKFTASLNLPQYATAPATPSNGDVYYNTNASKAYARVGGAWVEIGGSGGGAATATYQTTAPASPTVGQIWIDSDDNTTPVTLSVEIYPTFLLMGA